MWFELERATLNWAESEAYGSFHNEVELDASNDAVFEILADPAEWVKWFPDFERAEWLTGGEHGVGSRREVELDIMKVREEFIAWEPGERYAFTVYEMSLPLVRRFVEDYRLEPIGEERCRLLWDVYYEPRLLLRPLNSIMRIPFDSMFAEAMDHLRSYVANQPAAAG